jgi:hypothetical protein
MHTHYDAFEFTAFMDKYLKEHPEVVKDKRRGWNIYWNPTRVDPEALNPLGTESHSQQ